MNRSANITRIISNIIYAAGVAIVLALVLLALFGPNHVINPDAMLPFTWRECAFIWLSFGTIPMLFAALAVYRFNFLKSGIHKWRYFFIIFLPVFICGVCLLFIIVLIFAGYLNSFLLS